MTSSQWFLSEGIVRIPLRSRLIRACFYQPSTRTLALEMRAGGWRIHRNVDAHWFNELAMSNHPGHLYQSRLRYELPTPIGSWSMRALRFRWELRKKWAAGSAVASD